MSWLRPAHLLLRTFIRSRRKNGQERALIFSERQYGAAGKRHLPRNPAVGWYLGGRAGLAESASCGCLLKTRPRRRCCMACALVWLVR